MQPTSRLPLLLLLLLLILTTLTAPTAALRFYLNDRERRCFNFDATSGTRVIGERSIANGKGQAELSVEIKSPTGEIVYESHSGNARDTKFAFITPSHSNHHDAEPDYDMMDDEYDYEHFNAHVTYSACLVLSFDAALHVGHSARRAVLFWVRSEGNDPASAPAPRAKDEQVVRVHTSLQGMQAALSGIVGDLSALQQREKRLVKRSASTARRLVLFASVSLVVLVVTAVLQVMHFKTYFKGRKLL